MYNCLPGRLDDMLIVRGVTMYYNHQVLDLVATNKLSSFYRHVNINLNKNKNLNYSSK